MWKFAFWGLILVGIAEARDLPSYLKPCKRGIPDLHQCVVDNVEILRPRMKKGIPELFIPSLDPLVIPEATLSSGNDFKATFRHIELFRADTFKLDNFSIDLDRYHIDITIRFPSIRIKSNYQIKGRILILNLNGNGPADGNYTNVQTHLSLKGTPFKKNNKTFVRWNKDKIDIHIEKISIIFERLFGDNAELNDQTNKIINQNIDSIIEELNPVIQQVVSDFVFSLINRVFAKYSISELFPN